MPILYASGEGLNLLSRARAFAHGASSAGADPLFPEAYLWDGRPALPCRFLGNVEMSFDLAAYSNGDFETWLSASSLQGWTFDTLGGDGTLEQSAATAHSGSYGVKLLGGSNGVRLYREFRVRAGEKRKLSVWLTTNPPAVKSTSEKTEEPPPEPEEPEEPPPEPGDYGATVWLINKSTGRALSPTGAWESAAVPVVLGTTTYQQHSIEYEVESLHHCRQGMVTLLLELRAGVDAAAGADDLQDWPACDMLSLHGLLCQDGSTLEWSVSDDGMTWTDTIEGVDPDVGFAPDEIPTFYLRRPATTFKRWHKLFIGYAVYQPIEIGELVLSQVAALIDMADWGTELRVVEANIRNEMGDGDVQAFGHSRWPRRGVVFRWLHADRSEGAALAGMREARDELWGRARGGRHNILIVPRTDERQVLLVRAEDDFSVRRHFRVFSDQEQVLIELPFASTVM
jgi:hypothetical protein